MAIKELIHPACGRVLSTGFQILAVSDNDPRHAFIVAIRDGEYVVGTMYSPLTDTEWQNGFYSRNGATAITEWRRRAGI